jgi:hypothetical protein
VWDAEKKRFHPKLCASHYNMAVSGSEGASESPEAVENYINFRSARLLKTGACSCAGVRIDNRVADVKCLHALHSSFGSCEPNIRM